MYLPLSFRILLFYFMCIGVLSTVCDGWLGIKPSSSSRATSTPPHTQEVYKIKDQVFVMLLSQVCRAQLL